MCEANEPIVIHRSPFADWFATQDMLRGVSLCDRTSNRKMSLEPPAEWGRHWAWNVTEDGQGVYFRRTRGGVEDANIE